jgi:hypothetical protein
MAITDDEANLFDEIRGAVIDLPVGKILPGWVAKDAVIAMLDRIETEHAGQVRSFPFVAWEAAEAALPEGWLLEVGLWSAETNRPVGMPPYEATAEPYIYDPHEPGCIGRGETIAAAVEQLTAALVTRATEQGAR